MPELPEVETIRRGLLGLVGTTLGHVRQSGIPLRGQAALPLARLENQRVTALDRHGKYLLWRLSGGTLVVHLGMTGKLLLMRAAEPDRPHTHLAVGVGGGRELRLSDPRRFGVARLYPPAAGVPDVAHFGPDALDPAWRPESFAAGLAASRAPLKAFLLDQRRVAGIGNIYACEAMWRAGLSPRRQARRVARAKVPTLHAAVLATLNAAIGHGGTSFNDYVDAIGRPGQFAAELAVFQRAGQPCPRCGAAIRRIVQSGRSTFYCGGCQR